MGVGRGEKGKFSAALRKLVRPLWTAAGGATVDSGWRAGACRHGPGLAGSKLSIPASCTPRAVFQPAGVQGGAEQEIRCAWSGVGIAVFTAKASISRGRLLPVLQGAAPLPIRIGPWEKGVCFGNVVARDGHCGITLCLGWMKIKLQLNVIHERFKTQGREDTHTNTLSHMYAQLSLLGI